MRSPNESLKTRASARGRPSLFQRRRRLFQPRPGILPARARIGTEADAHQVREPSRHGANLFERLAFRCRRPPRQHFVEDHSHSVHVVARPGGGARVPALGSQIGGGAQRGARDAGPPPPPRPPPPAPPAAPAPPPHPRPRPPPPPPRGGH